jgi:AraC-like DNA-binding protein
MNRLWTYFALLLLASCAAVSEPETVEFGGVRFVHMGTERLPDMTVPRQYYRLLNLNGEFTAIGGHTTGFVLTQTAEYYKNGKWNQLPLLYAHDDPFCAVLPDGRVMVGGGYEKDFGIGQTWGAEVYDPSTHQFSFLPILDQKRAHPNALTLADGRVVVSGNWYAKDWTEVYDGSAFTFLRESSEQRSYPYILSTARDSAIIFGLQDTYNKPLEMVVDRLDGTSFTEPLLQEWRPLYFVSGDLRRFFIGDELADDYRWLIPAAHASGERAFLLVEGEKFSVVRWPFSLPAEGPWGPLMWGESIIPDRETGMVWIQSVNPELRGRQLLAGFSYAALLSGEEAPLTIYYSDDLDGLPCQGQLLPLPHGRFLMAGGDSGSNYEPLATALIFHTRPYRSGRSLWAWVVLTLALVAMGVVFVFRRKPCCRISAPPVPDLLSRINALMEKEQLFRRKDLRISDVATELGTNSTYISASLNSQLGVSFPNYLARYRVDYARDLMRRNPDMRLSDVAEESGFANESSFFRSFKKLTGLTPSEWKAK